MILVIPLSDALQQFIAMPWTIRNSRGTNFGGQILRLVVRPGWLRLKVTSIDDLHSCRQKEPYLVSRSLAASPYLFACGASCQDVQSVQNFQDPIHSQAEPDHRLAQPLLLGLPRNGTDE
jgi:hypothetical protein